MRKVFKSILDAIVSQVLTQSAGAGKENLEVERKFNLSRDEADCLPKRLEKLGFREEETSWMSDLFLPVSQEGELLRIRNETVGQKNTYILTAKTWQVMPDGGKERKERERVIGKSIARLLLRLGRLASGKKLIGFSKTRRSFARPHNKEATIALDVAEGLGKYSGLYMEVEHLVPVGGDVSTARKQIFQLVADLFGSEKAPVEMSYQQMLRLSLTNSQE